MAPSLQAATYSNQVLSNYEAQWDWVETGFLSHQAT
jgi:hypothetical protein